MLAMPRDWPILMNKLRWQLNKEDPTYIASIGIALANGSESTMFTGVKKEELSEIKEMDISHQIKTIFVSKYQGYYSIQNLEFRNKKGL